MQVNAPMRGSNGVKNGPMPDGGNVVIEVSSVIPEVPDTIGPAGGKMWIEISTILIKRGTWSRDWIPALHHTCRNYDTLAELDYAIKHSNPEDADEQQSSYVVYSNNARSTKMNPLLEYRLKVEAFIHSQLGAFGLTPLSSKGIFTQDESLQKKARVRTRDHSKPAFDRTP